MPGAGSRRRKRLSLGNEEVTYSYIKRRKITLTDDTEPKNSEPLAQQPTLLLTALPFETLAEIISWFPSPRDLLSLSRTNSSLRHALVNDHATYIWRRLRLNFSLPHPRRSQSTAEVLMPEPEELGLTEWGLVSLLFDSAKCEMCGKVDAKDGYVSFALKVRLCHRLQCRQRFRAEKCIDIGNELRQTPQTPDIAIHLAARALASGDVPVIEEAPQIDWAESGDSSHFNHLTRRSRWEQAIQKYTPIHSDNVLRSSEVDDAQYTIIRQQRKLAQERATKAYKWWKCHLDTIKWVQKQNVAFGIKIARSEGWNQYELMTSEHFSGLKRQMTNSLQELQQKDFERIRPLVQNDLNQNHLRRQKRRDNAALNTRQTDIIRFYKALVARSDEILPSFDVFCTLPVINVLEDKSSHIEHVIALLRGPHFGKLLEDELEEWREYMKMTLAGVLGFDGLDWVTGARSIRRGSFILNGHTFTRGKLHPVDRVTAIFDCQRCAPSLRHRSRCLDFHTACRHVCKDEHGRLRYDGTFDPDQFVSCDRAISAMEELLKVAGTSAETPNSIEELDRNAQYVLCGTCKSGIVMPWKRFARHSMRHPAGPLNPTLLKQHQFEGVIGQQPLVEESFVNKMISGWSKQPSFSQPTFGCRHCTQPPYQPLPSSEAGDYNSESTEEVVKAMGMASFGRRRRKVELTTSSPPNPTLYTFGGLVSHLIAKHNIDDIGIEDFYNKRDPEVVVE